jgi:hypothetical protein
VTRTPQPGAVAKQSLEGAGRWVPFFLNNVTAGSPGHSYSPHYGGYPSAVLAWAAAKTGLTRLFLSPARRYGR